MLIVSGFSFLFSPKSEEPSEAYLSIIGESEGEVTATEHTGTESEYVKSKTEELPFSFSVNVITEAEEETAVEYQIISPICRTMPHDITAVTLDELEKRKRYFIYLCKRLYCRLHSLKEVNL